MPKVATAKLLDTLPEAFVSDTTISQEVSRAVKAGRLRKLASRLYTRNLTEPPEAIVKRNLWNIVAGYFPGALVADRTAFEHAPASDGSVCLVSKSGKDIRLPGYTLRSRRGPPPLSTDRPFTSGLFLSSKARAFLENVRPSRARGGLVGRTLSRMEIREQLDRYIRRSGEDEVKKLRSEIRTPAKELDLEDEAADLDAMIVALLGAREAKPGAPTTTVRQAGRPFDTNRMALFHTLHAALRDHPPLTRLAPDRNPGERNTLAFYEAYFSNFIEGIKFAVEEASDIVFRGVIPDERPEDAHDVLGTWRLVSDIQERIRTPKDSGDLIRLLKTRHATIMEGRPDQRPGALKVKKNRAGMTFFVDPDLVIGTLEQGFALYRSLETSFQRAAFIKFVVSEIHPFADGNGRTARAIMNAELEAAGEERIIIPTVYRNNYIVALRALSQNGNPAPLIHMLDFAQRWTHAVDWRSVEETARELEDRNAFFDTGIADGEGLRLKMPGGAERKI